MSENVRIGFIDVAYYGYKGTIFILFEQIFVLYLDN